MTADKKRDKALELAITQIDRQFGKGSIMRLGENSFSQMDNVISTGCLSLDVALGVGGVPKEGSLKYMALNHLARPLSLFTL